MQVSVPLWKIQICNGVFHGVFDKENHVDQKFKECSLNSTLKKIVLIPSIVTCCSKLSLQCIAYTKI